MYSMMDTRAKRMETKVNNFIQCIQEIFNVVDRTGTNDLTEETDKGKIICYDCWSPAKDVKDILIEKLSQNGYTVTETMGRCLKYANRKRYIIFQNDERCGKPILLITKSWNNACTDPLNNNIVQEAPSLDSSRAILSNNDCHQVNDRPTKIYLEIEKKLCDENTDKIDIPVSILLPEEKTKLLDLLINNNYKVEKYILACNHVCNIHTCDLHLRDSIETELKFRCKHTCKPDVTSYDTFVNSFLKCESGEWFSISNMSPEFIAKIVYRVIDNINSAMCHSIYSSKYVSISVLNESVVNTLVQKLRECEYNVEYNSLIKRLGVSDDPLSHDLDF